MNIKFGLLAIIIVLCQSCELFVDHEYYIKIQNNSNDKVRCYASYNFPDTSLNQTKPRLQLINPKSFTTIGSQEKWDKVLAKDTLEIFIISEDTLIKYDWSIIQIDYKILKRFDLSIQDIERLGSNVIYP
jgi:hypothetical protein